MLGIRRILAFTIYLCILDNASALRGFSQWIARKMPVSFSLAEGKQYCEKVSKDIMTKSEAGEADEVGGRRTIEPAKANEADVRPRSLMTKVSNFINLGSLGKPPGPDEGGALQRAESMLGSAAANITNLIQVNGSVVTTTMSDKRVYQLAHKACADAAGVFMRHGDLLQGIMSSPKQAKRSLRKFLQEEAGKTNGTATSSSSHPRTSMFSFRKRESLAELAPKAIVQLTMEPEVGCVEMFKKAMPEDLHSHGESICSQLKTWRTENEEYVQRMATDLASLYPRK